MNYWVFQTPKTFKRTLILLGQHTKHVQSFGATLSTLFQIFWISFSSFRWSCFIVIYFIYWLVKFVPFYLFIYFYFYNYFYLNQWLQILQHFNVSLPARSWICFSWHFGLCRSEMHTGKQMWQTTPTHCTVLPQHARNSGSRAHRVCPCGKPGCHSWRGQTKILLKPFILVLS